MSEHYLQEELYERVRTDPELFDFIQAGSLDGIWYWDLTDPDHEWMSARFWETLGYDPAEQPHLASAWQDMIHPEDLHAALRSFEQHIADPTSPYDVLVRYTHREGHLVFVRCRGVAIRDEQGKPLRMLGAHTDLTALYNAREEVERRSNELETANTELERFAYAASHDLRSPALTISALLERLSTVHGDQLDSDATAVLDMARRSAKRMTRLTDSMSDYSKVSRARTDTTRVELSDLFTAVLEDLDEGIRRSGATVRVVGNAAVLGDQHLLHQLVQNLVENALKYAGPAPAVDLVVRTRGRQVEVAVRDSGPGIPADQHQRIFESFQRLELDSETPGVGLGLALCSHIARLHETSLSLDSGQGGGATFHFSLPEAA